MNFFIKIEDINDLISLFDASLGNYQNISKDRKTLSRIQQGMRFFIDLYVKFINFSIFNSIIQNLTIILNSIFFIFFNTILQKCEN